MALAPTRRATARWCRCGHREAWHGEPEGEGAPRGACTMYVDGDRDLLAPCPCPGFEPAGQPAGWAEVDDEVHWWCTDRRPACDLHATPLEAEAAWAPAAAGPDCCPACRDEVEQLHDRARSMGLEVTPAQPAYGTGG